jgi:glycosyltransferase involved in cell wall biosynthesis
MPNVVENRLAPLVTVVVPAWQAAWSIGETLASVSAQTYPNLEVVVVDDGSTDGTAEVVAACARRDPRIRLVRQANAGVAAARNRGVREAKGVYVAPIDSDDLWAPTNLERQVAVLEEAGPGAVMAFAETAYIDLEGRPLPCPPHAERNPRLDFEGLLRRNLISNGSAAVMRRNRILQAGGYDEALHARGGQGAEDWKLTLRLSLLGRVLMVRERLILYRVNPKGMSHLFDSMRRSVLAVIEEARDMAPETPEQAFRDARSLFAAWMLPRALRAGRWGLAAQLAAEAYLANPLGLRHPEPRLLIQDLLRAAVRRLRPPRSAEPARVETPERKRAA